LATEGRKALATLSEVLSATERSIAPVVSQRSDNLAIGSVCPAPAIERHDPAVERGKSDLAAAYRLHHNAELHSRLLPDENEARVAFLALEKARIQYLSVCWWPGMRANFFALFCFEAKKAVSEEHFSDRPGAKLSSACSVIVMEKLLEFAVPRAIKEATKDEIGQCEKVIEEVSELRSAASSQYEFACVAHKFLHRIGLERCFLDKEKLNRRAGDARDEYDPSELLKRRQRSQETSLNRGDETKQQRLKRVQQISTSIPDLREQSAALYKPFTLDYDEIVRATDLVDAAELVELRSKLDTHLHTVRFAIGALANRLQRKLQTLQQTSWTYDLEEGLLDVAKLTRVITDPAFSASYKIERESELGSIVVSILIDNSASMKGEPIALAACCAEILSQALERCDVKLEVLGFTTSQWNGGRSKQQWSSSRDPMPGRLNDLRHIIYKAADDRWRRCKAALALMMKDDILKENIDGEALLWAYERLKKRGEEHRILLVVSDGAPADHSTISLNGRDYLSENLRHVVSRIENEGVVDLVGIGVGHDLSKYYKRCVQINSMASLASVLTSELVTLFEQAIRKTKTA